MKNKFLIRTCGIFLRYALFQLPDLLILILILLISRHFLKISESAIFVIIGFWILKDIALYPFVGRYYDPDYQKDRFSLVGKKGTVKKPLKPKGKILIKGELWKAEVLDKDIAVNIDETVVVHEIKGLKLLVMPANSQKTQTNDTIT